VFVKLTVPACRSQKERSGRARFVRGLLRPGITCDDGGDTRPQQPLCLACLEQAGTLHNKNSVDGVQLASHVPTSVVSGGSTVSHRVFGDGYRATNFSFHVTPGGRVVKGDFRCDRENPAGSAADGAKGDEVHGDGGGDAQEGQPDPEVFDHEVASEADAKPE